MSSEEVNYFQLIVVNGRRSSWSTSDRNRTSRPPIFSFFFFKLVCSENVQSKLTTSKFNYVNKRL